MRKTNIFAGHTLLIEESRVEVTIEDWAENVLGTSWTSRLSLPTSIVYASRVLAKRIPIDNDVLYGKVGGLCMLVHVSELAFPVRRNALPNVRQLAGKESLKIEQKT